MFTLNCAAAPVPLTLRRCLTRAPAPPFSAVLLWRLFRRLPRLRAGRGGSRRGAHAGHHKQLQVGCID